MDSVPACPPLGAERSWRRGGLAAASVCRPEFEAVIRLDHPRGAVPDQALPTLRLKKRADFLRAATGRKSRSGSFTVQGIERNPASGDRARVGFTVTKKVGGAVERNRIRRRLRELVRLTPDLSMKSTHDYVIVARVSVLQARHETLSAELRSAIRKLNR